MIKNLNEEQVQIKITRVELGLIVRALDVGRVAGCKALIEKIVEDNDGQVGELAIEFHRDITSLIEKMKKV